MADYLASISCIWLPQSPGGEPSWAWLSPRVSISLQELPHSTSCPLLIGHQLFNWHVMLTHSTQAIIPTIPFIPKVTDLICFTSLEIHSHRISFEIFHFYFSLQSNRFSCGISVHIPFWSTPFPLLPPIPWDFEKGRSPCFTLPYPLFRSEEQRPVLVDVR